jgi:hypothetical protein
VLRSPVRFSPLDAPAGPTVTSVTAVGGLVARWTFSRTITVVPDAGDVFAIAGLDVDHISDNGDDWIEVTYSDTVTAGLAWSISPPTGIGFAGGGDVPVSSGTVS